MMAYDKKEFVALFNELQFDMYNNSKVHGFHEYDSNPYFPPTAIALIMSEGAEALEAHRKGETDKLPGELADIVIRTMDLAETLGIDLGTEILTKHEFNKTRPIKHGNKAY